MKVRSSFCCSLFCLVAISMGPSASRATAESLAQVDGNATSRPVHVIRDVALAPGGLLIGQVLDVSLQPIAGATVTIHLNGHAAASTATDAGGVFAVTGLRGGVHQIAAGDSLYTYRLWAPDTAPPSAESAVRLIPGHENVVRGQQFYEPPGSMHHRMKKWATNPWVVGGIVAAAITTPILLHNLDDDDDTGS